MTQWTETWMLSRRLDRFFEVRETLSKAQFILKLDNFAMGSRPDSIDKFFLRLWLISLFPLNFSLAGVYTIQVFEIYVYIHLFCCPKTHQILMPEIKNYFSVERN